MNLRSPTKKPRTPPAPKHFLDESVNNPLLFPMSGDGTADGDILAEAVLVHTDLSGPMGGPESV
jgi:hypothetical protein